MLLTKILVALQMLHHHVILGHPLALPKPLVKRAETPIEMLRGVKEDAGLRILIIVRSQWIRLDWKSKDPNPPRESQAHRVNAAHSIGYFF
ncbi:hypothetical protein KEM48_000059 [Puccinia striiformis f. sp. tritici PST-130]|nr:hypothetical protein KEM48_000059 [Puccinia striiformis f. sp. tritici PST-130]